MVEVMIGSGAKKKIQQVSLSNDTIRRWIDDMVANMCEIKQNTLQTSIQLDESADSALESHSIAFDRYEKNRKMKEEFLFSNTLSATTTASDVNALGHNFKHICTDGAPAMIDVKSGFVTLIKNEWPHVTSSHCSPHQYTVASKILPLHLMEVMDVAAKVINFTRLRGKNHRLFQLLTKEMKRNMLDFCFTTKSVDCREANASLGCMNLKRRLIPFLEKTKTTSMSNFTMKSLL